MNRLVVFIATGAYSGYSPVASGTAGTVVAIPLYYLLSALGHNVYIAAILILLPVSFWCSGKAEKIFDKKDSGFIVIDEIVGFLITMMFIPPVWSYVAAGFLLFRFFDITKLYPARVMEGLGGGFGVVMDDVVAGLYSNIAIRLLAAIGVPFVTAGRGC